MYNLEALKCISALENATTAPEIAIECIQLDRSRIIRAYSIKYIMRLLPRFALGSWKSGVFPACNFSGHKKPRVE